MVFTRTSMYFAAGLLAVALFAPTMAENDDDGWWSRWGMGRDMMDGWG